MEGGGQRGEADERTPLSPSEISLRSRNTILHRDMTPPSSTLFLSVSPLHTGLSVVCVSVCVCVFLCGLLYLYLLYSHVFVSFSCVNVALYPFLSIPTY